MVGRSQEPLSVKDTLDTLPDDRITSAPGFNKYKHSVFYLFYPCYVMLPMYKANKGVVVC